MDRQRSEFSRGPRSIGEIAERAFSLYGIAVIPCVLTSMISAIPAYAFLQYAQDTKALQPAMPQLQPANAVPTVVIPSGLWALGLLWIVVSIVAGMALTHVLAAAHTGDKLDARKITQRIAKRFVPTWAMLLGVYVAMTCCVFAVMLVIGLTYTLLSASLHATAAGLGFAVLEGMLAAMYFLPIWVLISQLVWVTYTLSSPPFVGGLRPILTLIFSALTRRRSFFFALAVLAVTLGTSIIAGAIYEITFLALRMIDLSIAFQMLVQSLAMPIVFGMVVIFAMDSNLLIAPQPEVELVDDTALLTE